MLNRKYLLNQKNDCNNNNILINSNNTNINSVTVVVGNQSKFPLRWKRRQLINCLLLFIILSIILLGLVIIGSLQINRLKMNCEQIKNLNQTIQQLTNKVERLNKEQRI
jgi:ABC-type enterobactin transport system permease subunit